jgi:hypothetical protein
VRIGDIRDRTPAQQESPVMTSKMDAIKNKTKLIQSRPNGLDVTRPSWKCANRSGEQSGNAVNSTV